MQPEHPGDEACESRDHLIDRNRNKKSLGEVSPGQNNANYPNFNYIPLKQRSRAVRRRETQAPRLSVLIEKLLGVIRAFMDTSIVECVGEEKADSYWKHVQRIADNDPKKLSSDFTGTFVSLRRSSVPVAVPVSPSKITV